MNLFYFDRGPLLAVFAIIAFVFVVTYLLSRQSVKSTRLVASLLLALSTLFCIETLWLTWHLIPDASYAQGKVFGQASGVLHDWVSQASINIGDLYFSWVLVLCCIVSAYFVRRSGPKKNHTHQREFYDHFAGNAAVAVVLTSIFYIYIAIPAYFESNVEVLDKILFRGPIPYITVGLFFWVMLNVVFLARRIIFQRKQDFDIQSSFDNHQQSEADNDDTAIDTAINSAISSASHQSTLKWRIEEIGKIKLKTSLNLSEYAQLVDQQSEMEREEIDVSMLYLHTAMWAIPVLGFLGTVWGIAEAVANLIPLMKGLSAANLGGGQLADALAGLGVAFDTTLVALSLSLPAMALISLLEKTAYEDMLVRNRIILRHVQQL
ncbi:MAG: biopolymer transport protein ExbB/TolQ [Alteromonadaceae bacterium]|jgi:biopolymer transport protein ExbB/TolQ